MIALDLHIGSFFFVYIVVVAGAYVRRRKCRKKLEIGELIVIFYALLVFKVAICPIIFLSKENQAVFGSQISGLHTYVQWIPFQSFHDTMLAETWIIQILGNVLLFFPIPILKDFRSSKTEDFRKNLWFAFVLSVSIEMCQLLFDVIGHYPAHIADIDDIICNVTGAAFGHLALWCLKKKRFYEKIKNIIKRGFLPDSNNI